MDLNKHNTGLLLCFSRSSSHWLYVYKNSLWATSQTSSRSWKLHLKVVLIWALRIPPATWDCPLSCLPTIFRFPIFAGKGGSFSWWDLCSGTITPEEHCPLLHTKAGIFFFVTVLWCYFFVTGLFVSFSKNLIPKEITSLSQNSIYSIDIKAWHRKKWPLVK